MHDPVSIYLVMIASLFLLGALGEMIFARTQIPDVVWLIAAGILLRVSGLVEPEALAEIQPLFGALTLIIVLFDGGSKLVVSELIKSAPRATLLAVLSFTFSTFTVALVSMGAQALGLLPDWTWSHAIMLGAILGGSSSLIIMPSMQLAKVEERVANLVSLESALTDALCVVVTVAMIGIVVSGETSAGATLVSLGKSFGIALAIGVGAGWTWMPVLRLLRGNQHAYPVTLAALIMLYVVVDGAGGSAAMAILAFAVIVGNADALIKRVGFSMGENPLQLDQSVRTVHTQLTFIIKSFFFTFIGLMLAPPWSLLFFGVVVGSVLLVARFPAVKLANLGAGFSPAQTKLVTISLPRGLAAGVLATMPTQAGVQGTENLPSLVFSAVVTSIVVFAVGFKLAHNVAADESRTVDQPEIDPVGDGQAPDRTPPGDPTGTGTEAGKTAAVVHAAEAEVEGELSMSAAIGEIVQGHRPREDSDSNADPRPNSGAVPAPSRFSERAGPRRSVATNLNLPKQPPALFGEGLNPPAVLDTETATDPPPHAESEDGTKSV
ncbi:MAG: cation:proton antiporter [Nannocystaceae bacterium]